MGQNLNEINTVNDKELEVNDPGDYVLKFPTAMILLKTEYMKFQ